jgi:hypothetical protein
LDGDIGIVKSDEQRSRERFGGRDFSNCKCRCDADPRLGVGCSLPQQRQRPRCAQLAE